MALPVLPSARNRSIRDAVLTSLLSKGSSAVLQFLSLPLAARTLGREEFGIYATISLAVFMVAMLQLGVGPALGRGISEASARSDRDREGRLYLSGAVLVVALASLGFLAAALLLVFVPVHVIFGADYAPHAETMRPALWIGVALMTGQIIVSMTDRVREGYMEAWIVNVWSAAGNLVGAAVVLVGVAFQPSVSFLLVAVFAPNILARLLNTILLLRKRPWLVDASVRPCRREMGELIRDGLSYSATSFVVYLTEFALCAIIIGRISGPADVAIFHVLMSVTTAFTGMLIMVGRPFWAAVVDARAKGDRDWTALATRRYCQYLAALTAVAGFALIGFGPWLVPQLYGAEFAADRLLFAGHAAFLLAIGWREVNRYLAIGLGLIPRTVVPILSGLAIGLVIGVIGLQTQGLWALFGGLAIGTLAVPGLILPRLVRASQEESPARTSGTLMPLRLSQRPARDASR